MESSNNYANITKYTRDYIISFDELIQEFKYIKPYNIPIVDIGVIRFLNNFTYELSNYYKWNISYDLIYKFNQMMQTKFPNFIYDKEYIQYIYNIQVHKRESPLSFKNKIFEYLEKKYKQCINYNILNQVKEYLKFRMKLSNNLDNLLNEYIIQWNKIEIQYNNTIKELYENYKYLENDESFNIVMNIISNIEKNAFDKIQPLITKHKNNIIKFTKDLNMIQYNDLIVNYNKIFSEEIYNIYSQIIKEYKFSEDIANILILLFKSDQLKYQLILKTDIEFKQSLDCLTSNLKNINENNI